jgi:hypothetical protein
MTSLLAATFLIAGQVTPLKVDRIDMGIRLRRLDAVWVKASDSEKQAAMPIINGAVMGFFSGQFGPVCQGLDLALSKIVHRDSEATDALIFRVRPQIYAPGEEVEVSIGWAYPVKMDGKIGIDWEGNHFELGSGEVMTTRVKTQARMMTMIFPPQHESVRGKADFVAEGKKYESGSAWLVNAKRFETMRLAESSPWAGLAEQVGMARSAGIESPFVVADAVARMDSVVPEKQDQLSPVYVREGNTVIRICAPDAPFGKIAQRKKVMIVLHGAGGSENMFPESYGAGHFVKLATDDGWLVLSPQATGNAVRDCRAWIKGHMGPLEKLVIAGHSMGGGLALAAASEDVDAIVTFAPAGGKAPEGIPFFVGVGAGEMAMLKGSVAALGKQATEYKVYPNAEHLMVVAEAGDDAWAFVKRVTAKREL